MAACPSCDAQASSIISPLKLLFWGTAMLAVANSPQTASPRNIFFICEILLCSEKHLHRALEIDSQTTDGIERIAQRFPHRGMRMNHVGHIIERRFEAQGGGRLGNDLSCQRTNGMDAEDLAILRFRYNLDEALVHSEDGRLAIR